MYKKGFVAFLRNAQDVVLREDNGKVWMPFYEEYKIVLKNKNNRKAVAKVFIDGEDVLCGKQLILNAWENIALERFVEYLNEGRRFQFVPRGDVRIEEKKDSPDLGIVEIQFQLEKFPAYRWTTDYCDCSTPKYVCDSGRVKAGGMSCSSTTSNVMTSCSFSPIGGTAEGSRSTQKFNIGSVGDLEDDVITIRLRILPTETTKTTVNDTKNIFCVHCGIKNIRKAKFCYQCGNKIEVGEC